MAEPWIPATNPPLSEPRSPPVDRRTRRWILASFWAVVLVGVPFWWHTTSLERRPLPVHRIEEWTRSWRDRIGLEAGGGLGRRDRQGLVDTLDPSVVKFSPSYNLLFSLLNQDASDGPALVDWDVDALLRRHISPVLSALAPLHNFTIETQVQYFAPLAVNLRRRGDGPNATRVEADDVKAFVNNAEWNLASGTTLDPVLQFILYSPSRSNRPMSFETPSGGAASSFIHPQRGGVVVYNLDPDDPDPSSLASLSPSFRLFSDQLRTLLGLETAVSPLTTTTTTTTTTSGPQVVTEQEVDALVAIRVEQAARETVETLEQLTKLVRDQPNMSVGRGVQERVNKALDLLDSAQTVPPRQALACVSRAHSLASLAFFDPSMLPLLYFPDEHKYAVYTPLFGPVSVPLVVGLLKEFQEWRQRRKAKAKAKTNEGEREQTKME